MGSSPLTRGKHRRVGDPHQPLGLIPAHAGKTPWKASQAYSRGGSSPLTRGKQRPPRYEVPRRGLIPAHAGKTSGRLLRAVLGRAHPRSRGENARSRGSTVVSSGSSPLTRGKLIWAATAVPATGLIPAHAGKTCPGRSTTSASAAHPRSRGENMPRKIDHKRISGSSPLTRGKLGRFAVWRFAGRLIPAHAGKTSECSVSVRRCPAHPRSRGENPGRTEVGASSLGSSPLTRGKRLLVLVGAVVERLIPAHAGKTDRAAPFWELHGAHPRSRGENGPWTDPGPRLGGSSPLTRGKRELSRDRLASWRLIPAHAGKT